MCRLIIQGLNGGLGLLASAAPAVEPGSKGRHDGYQVFHQIVRGLFSRVDDLDAKWRQSFKPPEAEARQAVLVLDKQHVEVLLLKQTVQLGALVVHAGGNLLNDVDNLVAARAGIGFEAVGLRLQGALVFGG